MILNNKNTDVQIIGEDTSKRAKISEAQLQKLQSLLTTGLYKDPMTAVIAEWTNNGVDSVVMAGKDPIQNPVMVTLGRKTNGQYFLSVADKGLGLDDKDFENVCMNYLESTKEQRNDAIGCYGIGMKSFLALKRPATFTCRKQGVERIYLVYEGKEFVNYDLTSQKTTSEPDGVIAELMIKDWSEFSSFETKAKNKLAYYDTVVLTINSGIVQNKIYRNDLFQWCTQNTSSSLNWGATGTMHLCLKDVFYPIDWDALGIQSIHIPIALRFSLTDGIQPTPSRESYITDDTTKKIILDRIKEVANWFFERYNKNVKKADTFLEAYPYIDNPFCNVILENKTFDINCLKDYVSIKIHQVQVKGITVQTPSDYKKRKDELFYEWDIVAQIINHKYTTRVKWLSISRLLLDNIYKSEIVLVPQTPIGNMREFLKSKYKNQTIFIKKSRMRSLGPIKNSPVESYYSLLSLDRIKKPNWKPKIKEWEFVRDQLVSAFKDETNVLSDKAYLDFVETKRAAQKLARQQNKTHNTYLGLGKKQGDVTIGYARQHSSWTGHTVFDKKVYKIADLEKNKYLTVLFSEEEKEQAAELYKFSKVTHIKFATIGKLEAKKIPNHFQFIKYQDFMTDSRPFQRLASAILFNKLLEDYKKIISTRNSIFANCMKEARKDFNELQKYVSEHIDTVGFINEAMTRTILDVADTKDLYDKSLWDVYLRVREATKKYEFVTCLKEPSSWDKEETRKYNRVINQMLLFRKKYYGDLPKEIKIDKDALKEDEKQLIAV